jgi:hypothetical protein
VLPVLERVAQVGYVRVALEVVHDLDLALDVLDVLAARELALRDRLARVRRALGAALGEARRAELAAAEDLAEVVGGGDVLRRCGGGKWWGERARTSEAAARAAARRGRGRRAARHSRRGTLRAPWRVPRRARLPARRLRASAARTPAGLIRHLARTWRSLPSTDSATPPLAVEVFTVCGGGRGRAAVGPGARGGRAIRSAGGGGAPRPGFAPLTAAAPDSFEGPQPILAGAWERAGEPPEDRDAGGAGREDRGDLG